MVSPSALPSLLMATTDSTKATGQYILVFGWELVLYEPNIVGSGPKDGCTVNLNDMVDEPFVKKKKGVPQNTLKSLLKNMSLSSEKCG